MTKIEWTEKTWNPTTGCDRISPGCDHCYALDMAKRLKAMGQAKYQRDGNPRTSGPGFGLTIHPDALDAPLHWTKPTTVFVNSMSDLFHARIPRWFIARVWAVLAATPQHQYQILTKRPERMARIIGNGPAGPQNLLELLDDEREAQVLYEAPWPLPNVLLGTSIESDEYTRRADALREASAATRFLSLEPLLGPLPSLDLTGIDWVILGGESGHGSRPMDVEWVRDLLAQCREAGAKPFVKQLGATWSREAGAGGAKGGEPEAWPEDLRVREMPHAPEAVAAR